MVVRPPLQSHAQIPWRYLASHVDSLWLKLRQFIGISKRCSSPIGRVCINPLPAQLSGLRHHLRFAFIKAIISRLSRFVGNLSCLFWKSVSPSHLLLTLLTISQPRWRPRHQAVLALLPKGQIHQLQKLRLVRGPSRSSIRVRIAKASSLA